MAPNIHIIFNIQDSATGGGNQFLKALRNGLRQRERYAETVSEADLFIFNSYQFIDETMSIKKRFSEKVMVHRIDGPIRLYNTPHDSRDTIVYTANKLFADATVFQSEWSRSENYRLGLRPNNYETVIPNAPDPSIFNIVGRISFSRERKVRLIASSWSANWKKGFDIYRWMDENLDFSTYEMTFVGNSPVKFKRIRTLPPMASKDLAVEFKKHDIFITASQKDPCSNSLIEALSCGLPAVALRDGGHPSIVGAGGDLFCTADQIPDLLSKLVHRYEDVQGLIRVPVIEEVVQSYCHFCDEVYGSLRSRANRPRMLTLLSETRMRCILTRIKIKERITSNEIQKSTSRSV
jgi:glycosyltransferase involved in cell wall biosynthesis